MNAGRKLCKLRITKREVVLPQAPSDLTEVLRPIWERLLQRPVDIHDDFFDLGGDPWIAVELFKEISKATKRELTPLLIFVAPTIVELSAVWQSPALPRFPTLTLLKPGTTGMPVFLLHGMGGNVMEFFQLLKHMQTPHPIYGLQARGTDGLENPCSNIEEMAHFYIDAIRVLQPHGPYLLVGYSLGGMVALEMACRLREYDESIALLVMIDSYPPIRYAPIAQQVRVSSRKARYYASRILGPAARKTIFTSVSRSDQTSQQVQTVARYAEAHNSLGIAFTPAMRRVQECATRALQDYQPRGYHGKFGSSGLGHPCIS